MANTWRDEGKERLWRERLKRQGSSGLTVREFCQREGVMESSFYAWRRTIDQRDGASNRQPGVRRPRSLPAFVPMVVTDESVRESWMEILLVGGRVLKLPALISADRLAEVVHALEAVAADRQRSSDVRGIR